LNGVTVHRLELLGFPEILTNPEEVGERVANPRLRRWGDPPKLPEEVFDFASPLLPQLSAICLTEKPHRASFSSPHEIATLVLHSQLSFEMNPTFPTSSRDVMLKVLISHYANDRVEGLWIYLSWLMGTSDNLAENLHLWPDSDLSAPPPVDSLCFEDSPARVSQVELMGNS
jgi:hypothetical protein